MVHLHHAGSLGSSVLSHPDPCVRHLGIEPEIVDRATLVELGDSGAVPSPTTKRHRKSHRRRNHAASIERRLAVERIVNGGILVPFLSIAKSVHRSAPDDRALTSPGAATLSSREEVHDPTPWRALTPV